MVKIARLTRHAATFEQVAALRVFGEISITNIPETLPSIPREAVEKFDELVGDASVVEVVLPINLVEAVLKFSRFCQDGGTLIRSVMINRQVEGEEPSYSFSHYEVIERVEIVTRRLPDPLE